MSSILNRIKLLEDDIRNMDTNSSKKEKIIIPRDNNRAEKYQKILYQRCLKYIKDGANGNLNLSDTPIKTLPPELIRVGGNLTLNKCQSLTSIPESLKLVQGYLDLSGCKSLKSLPNNLTVGANLNLFLCTSLKSLPNNLKVGSSINAPHNSFESLPNDLKLINGHLYLHNCDHLKTLPDGLVVDGDLSLVNDSALISLSKGLIVKGDLDLTNCIALTSLPYGLKVDGALYIKGTRFAKKYNTEILIRKYLNSINAVVNGKVRGI